MTLYVVMRLQNWSDLEIQGGPLARQQATAPIFDGAITKSVGFIMVFTHYADALAWADGDASIVMELMTRVVEGATALPAWYELRKAGAAPLPGFE